MLSQRARQALDVHCRVWPAVWQKSPWSCFLLLRIPCVSGLASGSQQAALKLNLGICFRLLDHGKET